MRHPQWEARLLALVSKNRFRAHEYGRHDCIIWGAEITKAVTGKDHARGHRGKYRTKLSAARYLKTKFGVETPEALIDQYLTEKPVGFAQRGDLVMTADGIPALCMGAYALSVGEEGNREGLVGIPRSQWVKAWKVGL